MVTTYKKHFVCKRNQTLLLHNLPPYSKIPCKRIFRKHELMVFSQQYKIIQLFLSQVGKRIRLLIPFTRAVNCKPFIYRMVTIRRKGSLI